MIKNDSQVTIRAPSDVIEKIKQMGEKSGRKASGELRQALIEYVERHSEESKVDYLIDELENDPLFEELNPKYQAIKKKLVQELDEEFLKYMDKKSP